MGNNERIKTRRCAGGEIAPTQCRNHRVLRFRNKAAADLHVDALAIVPLPRSPAVTIGLLATEVGCYNITVRIRN